MEGIDIDDMEFPKFAIENSGKLLSYIESRKLNIRIHRDITGLISDNYQGVIYRINYGK